MLTDASSVALPRQGCSQHHQSQPPRRRDGRYLAGPAAAIVLALCLTACAGSPPTSPPSAALAESSAVALSIQSSASSAQSPIKASTNAPAIPPPASSVAVAVAPICTKEALQDAVNVGRDNPLTVSDADFKCQDTWAVAGANDLVNKAQYTFLLQWADGQWQRVADRTQACANNEVPATLFALGCQSN